MMAIQTACNRENDLCENKNKKRKTREKDTTRAEERRNGGRIRQTKGRRRPRSASTRGADAAKRERWPAATSERVCRRTTSCPVARCHPALPLPLRSDWQDRLPGHGRAGYMWPPNRTMRKTPSKPVSIFIYFFYFDH